MASADRFLLATMTSPQVHAEIAAGRTTIVVPFGAVEQHGPHLPLDTDTVLADRLGPLIAERLDGLCAPTVPIGCSKHHLAFAGTLSFQPETLHMVVRDLVESLAAHGFRRIVLLPTHGGNEEPLRQAATVSRRDGITLVVPGLGAIVAALLADASARGVTPGDQGGHAGELETSLMLALVPDLVRTSSMEPGYMGPLDDAATRVFFDQGAAALSPNGVIGDPRGSSPAAGHAYVAAFLDSVEAQLRQIDHHDKA
jgi:creatinine amidohydrolase